MIEVIPIFGYLLNRGRCRHCGEKIPLHHIFTELASGALFTASYLLLGMKLELIVAFVMILVLLIELLSDCEHGVVIDSVWFFGLVLLVPVSIIQGEFIEHLLSSGIMFSIMFLIAFLGAKVFKKEVLGGGDVKLYIFIGFCLTWPEGILSLFLASFVGFLYGVIRKNNTGIPFVPMIAIAVVLSYFFGEYVIDLYLRMIGA
jgi:prepilin signal peptidase PulO-like enzyme (type II secretory pathway)